MKSSSDGENPSFPPPIPPIPPDPSPYAHSIQHVTSPPGETEQQIRLNGFFEAQPPLDISPQSVPSSPVNQDAEVLSPPAPKEGSDNSPNLSENRCKEDDSSLLLPDLNKDRSKSKSPKSIAKFLRSRVYQKSSGDTELDAIRAQAIAHDAKIQEEADRANGIKRSTRNRTKQSGVQIAGFGVIRKQKKGVKYSPMLADLRVKEFVAGGCKKSQNLNAEPAEIEKNGTKMQKISTGPLEAAPGPMGLTTEGIFTPNSVTSVQDVNVSPMEDVCVISDNVVSAGSSNFCAAVNAMVGR